MVPICWLDNASALKNNNCCTPVGRTNRLLKALAIFLIARAFVISGTISILLAELSLGTINVTPQVAQPLHFDLHQLYQSVPVLKCFLSCVRSGCGTAIDDAFGKKHEG